MALISKQDEDQLPPLPKYDVIYILLKIPTIYKCRYPYIHLGCGLMSVHSGYLTPKQVRIWGLRRRGVRQAEIARRMGVLRQGINRAVLSIDTKVGKALVDAAELNKLDIRSIDPVNGILEAYSPAYKVPAIVSFSEANGVQLWYLYEGKCLDCDRRQACRNMLEAEARERGIELTNQDKELTPTLLAKKIFSRYSKML